MPTKRRAASAALLARVCAGEAQRSLSLLQAAFAPGDPLSFAPKIGAQGKSMLLLEARSDERAVAIAFDVESP